MFEKLFNGIFALEGQAVISITDFLLCILISVVAGVIIALSYTYKSRYTKSFIMTICILPAVVCAVIMMVNGNIGTGVAVAGAFSLVRFRSAPGSAKEICTIFIAMGTGLISGMGYLGYSVLFAILMGIVTVIFKSVRMGRVKDNSKSLLITVPEDLNYDEMFNDILKKYTQSFEMVSVRLHAVFRFPFPLCP